VRRWEGERRGMTEAMEFGIRNAECGKIRKGTGQGTEGRGQLAKLLDNCSGLSPAAGKKTADQIEKATF